MALDDAFDPEAVLALSVVATFVFGLSGGMAAVRAGLDLFGVLVLAAVVGLAGGVTRDLLIGIAPTTFRDGRYLAAVGAAGLVCIAAHARLERIGSAVLLFDAIGLSLFCVTGATTALAFGLSAPQAVILGAVTAIGGGMLRDVLLLEVPTVLRSELYAVPAVLGAAVVAVAHAFGSDSALWALLGAALCLAVRLFGMRYRVDLPSAPVRWRRQR